MYMCSFMFLLLVTSIHKCSCQSTWPRGGRFGSGSINLGGLIVAQVTTFNKVWTTYEGGWNNTGATFFEPVGLPEGFYLLGYSTRPNNRVLSGPVLVVKDAIQGSNPGLARPTDYELVWRSNGSSVKQDSVGYIWAPIAPNGYHSLGHVVTTTAHKPSLEKVRCVRSDLTASYEPDGSILGLNNEVNIYEPGFNSRVDQATVLNIGTFMVRSTSTAATNDMPVVANSLKNTNTGANSMPNLDQVKKIIQTYSPVIYFHPDDEFLPSSVDWFFTNGALLYEKGKESSPIPINSNGSNLPQTGSDDGSYWLDLPTDATSADNLRKGDLGSASAYIHLKPVLGGTYTDFAVWLFYPFNGASRAKVTTFTIPLGQIGQHVGDWEHVTFRVSNFDGKLQKVYFAQHSSGEWVDASNLEFQDGNKFVVYSSLHGHASYPQPGLVLQGGKLVGIRNDAAKSGKILDTGKSYTIISGDYLESGIITEPPWLNYARRWGPKIAYDVDGEIGKVAKGIPSILRPSFRKVINSLPRELLGQDGPVGPKMKSSWAGDEE